MSECGADQPTIEFLGNLEVEKLSRELFFHFVDPRSYAPVVARSIIEGSGLFGIAGRATVRRGYPDSYGPNLVFRIPENCQSQLLTTNLDPSTDPGLKSGGDAILALSQGFSGKLTAGEQQSVTKWLNSPYRSRTMDQMAKQPLSQIQHLIRYLEPKYFCGLYIIEEDTGQKAIRKAEKLIYPFVQNVTCVVPGPQNPLGSAQLEQGINYYIRYNPLNKSTWR